MIFPFFLGVVFPPLKVRGPEFSRDTSPFMLENFMEVGKPNSFTNGKRRMCFCGDALDVTALQEQNLESFVQLSKMRSIAALLPVLFKLKVEKPAFTSLLLL